MRRFGCVILTMGDRPEELRHAVASVLAQREVVVDVVVVVNGAVDPPPDVLGARLLPLAENAGIPGGRNAGLEEVEGDLVLFLDDDATLGDETTLARAAAIFEGNPAIGIVSIRIVDPSGEPGQRRHVPRLRTGEPGRSSEVTTFLGGASIVRREVFEAVGPFPQHFFYAHEELDLAWRALDAGYRVWYAGNLVVHHPSAPASRHPSYHYLTMRNRVFLARRRLPWILALPYVIMWVVISMLRRPRFRDLLRGLRDGIVEDAGERKPIGWSTIWHMTRIGRPPLI